MRAIIAAAVGVALVLSAGASVARESEPIKVEGAKNARGVQAVVIGSFAVAFITEKTDEAFAGNRRLNAATGTITRSRLAGVDPAVFQAITDEAFADFQNRLTGAGYTIADRAAMLADSRFARAEFAEAGAMGTVRFGRDSKAKATYYSPTAFGGRGLMRGEVGNGETGGLGGGLMRMGGLGGLGAMRAAGPAMARTMYAATAHQPTISVLYVIDFADAQRYGGRYAIQAAVNVRANLAVVDTHSILTALNAKGQPATLTVAQPIAVGGDFGTLADTTSGGTRAGNIIGAGIAGLTGGGGNQYQNATFTAVPDRYREGAVQATVAANTRLIERLTSLR